MHDRASRCGIRWGELRWADSGGRTRMSKRDLSEADICAKFITPHVENAGWDDATQIRREVHFTKGQIHVRGKMVTRGKSKFADYVLYYKPNIPIAIIEAKENNHAVGDGLQQALEYAEVLNIPFVFSSNGDGFVFHDRTGTLPAVETTLPLESFPSPARLWAIYRGWKGLSADQEHVVLQDYFDDGSERQPRYYQRNAINAATEAIAKGQNRLLLVMATGTGKTYTAFQIIWRLWKANRKKRVLYLADRNILIDQTMVNDFRPFGPAMAKLNPAPRTIESADGTTNQIANALDRQRRIDPSYEIYLGLYQAITGPEERQKLFREFSPGFFDLIVIDECHRGSAADDAAWREILEYFSAATQIGMTATPKETKYVSNIHYFGEPVYTYSLKQGIQDGFLAPYKVINVHIDVDVDGYRPSRGTTDIAGEPVQIYDPDEDDPIVPPTDDEEIPDDEIVIDGGNDISINENEPPSRKLYVNGVLVTIIAERVKYLDADGTLINESLRDYSRKAVVGHFASLDMFLRRWKGADRKQAIIDELGAEGLRIEPLADEVSPNLDPCDPRVLQLAPIDTFGTPVELIRQFGSRAGFEQAAHELQDALYESA